MVFDASVALTWLLFLALFPMAFFWLRRAWRIGVRREFGEVALKRGVGPRAPQRWAFQAAAINGLAGAVALSVIFGVAVYGWPYDTWTAIAGSTIWSKFFLDFALSRHAHAADARQAAAAAGASKSG